MAIWKDATSPKKDAPMTPAPAAPEPAFRREPDSSMDNSFSPSSMRRPAREGRESMIAADITIEGKIEGGGSVRLAGKFKGDVSVQGDLTIEAGAKLTGSVRADKVTIAGELEGNVEQASLVDLQQTGVVVGDIKAGTLTVAAGARLRGSAEFGLDDGKGPKATKHGV